MTPFHETTKDCTVRRGNSLWKAADLVRRCNMQVGGIDLACIEECFCASRPVSVATLGPVCVFEEWASCKSFLALNHEERHISAKLLLNC